jgi:hypothetical protein
VERVVLFAIPVNADRDPRNLVLFRQRRQGRL